ncbi:MAG: radical SAM protein [Proteobacteria bacterium]|nr:radical SAM protein [Pseudomonadota bacterium]
MKSSAAFPSYIGLMKSGELARRAGRAWAAMRSCRLCPRDCGADRIAGELGYCRIGKRAGVASANLHHGEEPPISGTRGSGTIFFTGCNMSCRFCQNWPISHLRHGETVTAARLGRMMLGLQRMGAHNINLVTPSHVVPQFLAGLAVAAKEGLSLPIVYNSNGYEGMDALALLDGVIDIYMPDMKYSTRESAGRCSLAADYWEHARPAVKEMYRQVGALRMDGDGIGVRGLLIRHLVLPGGLAGSEKVFEFIAKELSTDVPVNLMSQYFPAHDAVEDPLLGRRITRDEFKEAEAALLRHGLTEGWIQRIED